MSITKRWREHIEAWQGSGLGTEITLWQIP